MIDSGAEISIFKHAKLKNAGYINNNEYVAITGIHQHPIDTLGSANVQLNLSDNCLINHKFHIIHDDLPIPTDGILGRDFLTKFHCNINYDTWTLTSFIHSEQIEIPIQDNFNGDLLIPPRCEVYRQLNLEKTNQNYFLPSSELQPGIFCANCIINSNNPIVKLINTTNSSIKLQTEFALLLQPLENYNIFTFNQPNQFNREQTCISELNLNNTPTYAQDKLKNLCQKYNDIFALQNDMLTANNFYKQKIHLNDQTPVYIKNYRMPEVHRTEMDRQVTKMLNEQLIQPSISPYNSPVL